MTPIHDCHGHDKSRDDYLERLVTENKGLRAEIERLKKNSSESLLKQLAHKNQQFIEAITQIEVMIQAVQDEPENPGKMPDEMWEIIRNDRDACEKSFRINTQLFKQNVLAKALASPFISNQKAKWEATKELIHTLKQAEKAWNGNRDVPYHCWNFLSKVLKEYERLSEGSK